MAGLRTTHALPRKYSVFIQTKLEASTLDALKKMCEKHEVSVAEWLRHTLEEFVEQNLKGKT